MGKLRNEIFGKLALNGANMFYVDIKDETSSNVFVKGKMYRIKEFEKSNYREENLKEEWSKREMDSVEGIYQRDLSFIENKYAESIIRVALVKTSDSTYKMIYLDGFEDVVPSKGLLDLKRTWRKGDVLANIQKTNNQRLFNADIYGFDKHLYEDCMISLDNNNLRLSFSNGFLTYIKSYPTASRYEALVGSLTGFGINNKQIMTCYHGVEDKDYYYYVKGINGDFNTKYEAVVEKFDKSKDIAILKLLDSTITIDKLTIPVSLEEKSIAEDIFVLGYPISVIMGEDIKLTNGIINSLSGQAGNTSYYQFSAPIQSGNSGSPLFDKNGNFIGLVSSSVTNTDNVGYALKMKQVNDFLVKNQISNIFQSENIYSSLSLAEKVKKLKESIYIIEIISHKRPRVKRNQFGNPIR